MSETARMWVEVIFNISYLAVIWSLVVLMIQRRSVVAPHERPVAARLIWAFGLLALGDTGHVGFRVIAYALGGLESHSLLVGIGSLATAVTVTLFYMLLVGVWQVRFGLPLGWFGRALLAAGVIRLVVMAFPQNQWGLLVAPFSWSLLRNAFLVVQGLGVMVLILRDAWRTGDSAFSWIGNMIALSYACYAPVILWASAVPMLGMLMIPKTCAYVAVAIIAYRAFFRLGSAAALQQSFPAT